MIKKQYAGLTPYCTSTKKILIVQRGPMISNPKKWCAFGGGANENETPVDCAKREFEEESGHDSLLYYMKKGSYDHNMLNAKYINYWGIFKDEFIPKIGKKTVDGVVEITDYAWVNPEEALKYDLIFGFRNFIKNETKDLIDL